MNKKMLLPLAIGVALLAVSIWLWARLPDPGDMGGIGIVCLDGVLVRENFPGFFVFAGAVVLFMGSIVAFGFACGHWESGEEGEIGDEDTEA